MGNPSSAVLRYFYVSFHSVLDILYILNPERRKNIVITVKEKKMFVNEN